MRQTDSACPNPGPDSVGGRGEGNAEGAETHRERTSFFRTVHKDLYLTQTLAEEVFTP